MNDFFQQAQPIWPTNRETEMNLSVGFRATFECVKHQKVEVRVAASTLYRLWVNGEFAGYGPARAGHGFYRVDEWDVTRFCHAETNVVALEVVGYNVNSYYVLDQPSFLQAEVLCEGNVLAATNENFGLRVLEERVQRVQRYSFQRPFVEVYRLQQGFDAWRCDLEIADSDIDYSIVSNKALIPREMPYPRFACVAPSRVVGVGSVQKSELEWRWTDRSFTEIGEQLKGYHEVELDIVLSDETLSYKTHALQCTSNATAFPHRLGQDSFQIFDMGGEKSGFIALSLKCEAPLQLFVTFDELLDEQGDVNFLRFECVNSIKWELEAGEYHLESFECYSLRYAKVFVVGGACELRSFAVREYSNDEVWKAQFSCSNRDLNFLFEAARETFRQNATDLFMDCPSRERAGWLCDSLFTSRVALDLIGDTQMERAFLQNYALQDGFAPLPAGVLPMCYPADHLDGNFIPNWMLWFVLQLNEYSMRAADSELLEQLRPKVQGVFDYLARFCNDDELLEGLEGWVFIEWSKANDFKDDVNYPSNMLYAAALEAAARLYKVETWNEQAQRLRAKITEQSWRYGWFRDNAIRENGVLKTTKNRTEVCQYYAFYFGFASPETHGELWGNLRDKLGPTRRIEGTLDDVHPANALMGNVLRIELLSRYNEQAQVVEECVPYWMSMAEKTGTLWEHNDTHASCNHGFASHAAHVLRRDIGGLRVLDVVNKRVELHFANIALDWCDVRLPTPDGFVHVRWWREGGAIRHSIQVPRGYVVNVV